ncbi:unnamed protein product [Arabis nemorensis]|uniref:Serine-threonine/tyrosine-protein kinase catalytic domain-containing protein n=1 Tax=Arabis nemorensis TaxID=586526 RepID=A0A565B095_9BRAS|nr:unnamed protein product [Arabis nemorensis]
MDNNEPPFSYRVTGEAARLRRSRLRSQRAEYERLAGIEPVVFANLPDFPDLFVWERPAKVGVVKPSQETAEKSDWIIDKGSVIIGKRIERDLYTGTFGNETVNIKYLSPRIDAKELRHYCARELEPQKYCENPTCWHLVKEHGCHIRASACGGRKVSDSQQKDFASLVRIALDVSEGMSFLHGKNIVHGNLCKKNIVMGQNKMAKICGFGLAGGNIHQQMGCLLLRLCHMGNLNWKVAQDILEEYPGTQLLEDLEADSDPLLPISKFLIMMLSDQTDTKLLQLFDMCWIQLPTPSFQQISEFLRKMI